MKPEKIKLYVTKTIQYISEKGHILLSWQPKLSYVSFLFECATMATKLRTYEKIMAVVIATKDRIPTFDKMKETTKIKLKGDK